MTKALQNLVACAVLAAVGAAEPIQWKEGNGYRYFEISPLPAERPAGFTLLDGSTTGVQFTNALSRRMVAMNRVTENGSGVALGDIDGDGWCDIYLCRLEGNNVLYRNLGGWKFEDITSQAGVECANQLSTGAIFGDIDGDGDLDLFVNSIGGGTRVLLNDGRGKFTENPAGRIVRRFGSTSMALADIDRDGDLDLYVVNYRTITARDEFPRPKVEARMQNGEVVITPPGRYVPLPAGKGAVELFEVGERDFLYLNDGKGHFAPVSWTNGNFLNEFGQPLTKSPVEWSLSVMMRDINDDGLIDILVCNDFFLSPDHVWIQQPGMQFKQASLNSLRKVSLASMAVDVADINRDGLDDLFFVEMLSRDFGFRQNHRDNVMKGLFNLRVTDPLHRWEVPRNTLFLNMGDGSYAEIAELAGVDASEWSWGALFIDVDLDGWEDLLIPTGHNHDVQNADVLRTLGQTRAPDSIERRIWELDHFPRLNTPIIAFRNQGGLRFVEKQEEWGLNIPGVLNGFACADLDNDGDLDLVGNRLNGSALLFRNDAAGDRIAIRLAGSGANTKGIGAKIAVSGKRGSMRQEMIAGGRYLSGDDAIRTFAATPGEQHAVEVRWAEGTRTTVSGLKANAVYEISQKGARPYVNPGKLTDHFFADRSELLDHRHSDPPFDDFQRQPLLPYSLASQGPALVWTDLDGDGWDDLIVGGARGGQMSILVNAGNTFVRLTNSLTNVRLLEDQMGIVASSGIGSNGVGIVSAISNYESGGRHNPTAEVRTFRSHEGVLPPEIDTPGALALADVDGDGALDLFVAGRVIPGRYPAPASSRIYLNRAGAFSLSPEWSRPLEKLGLVAGAQFCDFNGDGKPDMVVAAEWGSVQVFLNNGKTFESEYDSLGQKLGWWTSVVTGDFDNDGLTDIVAGNWGRNTKYERFVSKHPLRIYFGDLDGNGSFEALKALFSPTLRRFVPIAGPEAVIEHLPLAAERITSYEAYTRTGIDELIASASPAMLEINTMDSMLFLNRGSHFEARPLPIEAQFAPVFGLAVADFDNDGNQDLVLGQNLFDTRWDIGRLDSGRPLWLRGDGKGNFTTVSPVESGLSAHGQQRAVAVSDFNGDGRIDLAMTQNSGETKLFENRKGNAGVRLRFVGAPKNPDAIGTKYAVVAADETLMGGVREIQAGGGWLSQDSFVQVVPRPSRGARLRVHWPGGTKNVFDFPTNGSEWIVSETGIKVVR